MRRMASIRKYIDIGANLTDEMYQGVYHTSKKHEPDLDRVLERSWANGMCKMIITGGSLIDSKKAIDLSYTDSRLYATVGCHPTRCNEFVENPETYLNDLRDVITNHREKVVAIGECGLDYERLHFCEKDIQLKYFEYQLKLSGEFNLPLFLHCRAAADDLVDVLKRNKDDIVGGVVHSFDGPQDALEKILELGMYIGINGCSLRTKENLEVVTKIPQDRLMIETDCPWCEVKPTHPGYTHVVTKFTAVKKEKYSIDSGNQVKGRNEPVNIVQVLEILAAVRKENIDELAEAIFNNTNTLFFSK
ncbi:PREDICTED: putative deoxyribonuclease TATDN1 isoform X1 [Papilio xuthus]|uniref:Deoxyribonuclease TATDN1 n=2 Tax=Papilio xuthus TaxID=66420 RepID=A0AAJ6Z085_PAPXU|nr:PREDICTED: putative deoxyribonuclease TATDN1 isoform X1 [Papilio xuthus]